jgi:hypothetical protein
MADAGVPVHVLRKIAGHGSLITTQRYLHPDAQSITDAGDALSAHLTGKRSPAASCLDHHAGRREDAKRPADLGFHLSQRACRTGRDGGI